MDRSEKIKLLKRALGEGTLVERKQEMVFKCPRPNCKGKEKLSVSLETGRFHCWICDWSGRTYLPLLRGRVPHTDIDTYCSSLGISREAPSEKEFEVPALPEGFELIELSRTRSSIQARSYLRGRGITPDMSLQFKLGVTEIAPYAGRIVIPSFDAEGKLNFVTTRKIDRFSKGPKYVHCGTYDKDIVFNELFVDWERPVTIVEGPFDSFKVDNCIPLQGNSLRSSSRLLERLVEHEAEVRLALDQDAARQQDRIVRMLASFGVDVSISPLGGNKDFGSMAPAQISAMLERSRPANTEADMLRVRIGR